MNESLDSKLGKAETLKKIRMEKRRVIKHFRDLDVYRLAFVCAMKIFNITKSFPEEERYSMVDQIRRSSRSVCSNLSEAWRKRKCEAVFKNKLTDSMQEASETQCWLEFANACSYYYARSIQGI